MGETEVTALKAAFDAASGYSEWSVIAVVLGVFIEFLALFIFKNDMAPLEKWVMAFATLVIVAGCGGEYVFGGRATIAAVRLQDISDNNVARLQSAAKAEAGRIADAQRDAANANERAAKLEAANLQLEKELQPRRVDPVRLARAMNSFSGLVQARVHTIEDMETRRLSSQIGFAVRLASWLPSGGTLDRSLDINSPFESINPNADFEDGVTVYYPTTKPEGPGELAPGELAILDRTRDAAIGLSAGLMEQNIQAVASPLPLGQPFVAGGEVILLSSVVTVVITVGLKPVNIQH